MEWLLIAVPLGGRLDRPRLRGAILVSVPSLGELVSERGGVLNIGLEGMGAYAGFVAANHGGKGGRGFGAGMLAGAGAAADGVFCVHRGLGPNCRGDCHHAHV